MGQQQDSGLESEAIIDKKCQMIKGADTRNDRVLIVTWIM